MVDRERRIFGDSRSLTIAAYLAEQANYLIGRIKIAKESDQLYGPPHKQAETMARRQEVENADILITQALGAISVIGRDGATEKDLKKFEEMGAQMNSAVRF